MYKLCYLLFICFVHGDYPFRDATLPWEARVDDLVQRLTLDEVVLQMARGGGGTEAGPAPPINRLGIKPFQWNSECLRGVAFSGKATAFPQSINLGSTFSQHLMKEVAEAIGLEKRAKYNNYTAHGSYGDHQGINCFSPMVNIMRHPLWGRNQEEYGEDPYLTGTLAAAYVKGLQGPDERYVLASSTCKAYIAYAGPENIPVSRLTFDAQVSERDLRLTFLPAYKMCLEAGTYSYMCSYNSVNGVPVCANRRLLTDILREEWGFKGFVISDMGAIEATVQTHKYVPDRLAAVVAAVTAGVNLELSNNLRDPYYMHIGDAVNASLINETYVRDLVKPLFYTRMRLGEFDPPDMNPYSKLDLSLVQSEAHQQLAVTAAMQSFVLLKNDGLLPLKTTFKQVAVVGPMADNLGELYGDYNADIDPAYASTPLQGLHDLADTVTYGAGCADTPCTNYTMDDVKRAVSGSQLVVVCLGTGVHVECEGRDRPDMYLPGKQAQLLSDALNYAAGSPVLLLLFSASPVNISHVHPDPRVGAILQCGFPAQATGEAVYNTITTLAPYHRSPAGRLPYTWYDTSDQIPSMTNYSMQHHTYRYFTGPGQPLYPFGYGLSYSTFTYSDLIYDSVVLAGAHLSGRVQVRNDGDAHSDEVVQVYVEWLTTKEVMPQLQLVAYDRVHIPSHQSVMFDFTITPGQMAVWTDDRGFVVEQGEIMLYVGGQQPNQKTTVPSNVLHATVTIHGAVKLK